MQQPHLLVLRGFAEAQDKGVRFRAASAADLQGTLHCLQSQQQLPSPQVHLNAMHPALLRPFTGAVREYPRDYLGILTKTALHKTTGKEALNFDAQYGTL